MSTPLRTATLTALLLVGCASSPEKLAESTGNAASAPISVQDAFSRAAPLTLGRGPDISVLPGHVPLVTLGSTSVLVVPATLDGSRPWIVTVRSRVVRKSDETFVLFYPVISIVDQGFNVTRTLKPTYEFSYSASENILSNEFKLPIGTERILIHTTDEFVRGSFVGSIVPSDDSGKFYLGTLFGAIGALVDMAVYSATKSDANQIGPTQYRFGEVGMISVEAH